MTKRRLLIAAAVAVCAAAAAPVHASSEPVLCAALDQLDVGVCVYDPLPDRLPLPESSDGSQS